MVIGNTYISFGVQPRKIKASAIGLDWTFDRSLIGPEFLIYLNLAFISFYMVVTVGDL